MVACTRTKIEKAAGLESATLRVCGCASRVSWAWCVRVIELELGKAL
jgi:hypothetical protein